MELEVGTYVRVRPCVGFTNNAVMIKQVIAFEPKKKWACASDTWWFDDGTTVRRNEYDFRYYKVAPKSKNIINLVKVGDLVNKLEVEDIIEADEDGNRCLKCACMTYIWNKDIRTVVTKEQLESVQYTLGGE